MAKRVRKPAHSAATTVPADQRETRRAKFLRLGKTRMERVLNSIRLIGNLANANYDWTPEDIVHIRETTIDTLNHTLARFQPRKRGEKIGFEFAHPTDQDEEF